MRAAETITLAVPPAAVVTRRRPTLEAPWIVLPSAGVPTIRESVDGPLLTEIRELALRANGSTLFFQIASDGFVPEVGDDTRESVALIDSIVSQQSEVGGWNNIVRKRLTYEHVVRHAGGAVVELHVPPYDDYDVLGPETLTILLPASTLLSGQAIRLAQTIEVLAVTGSATTGGSLAAQFADAVARHSPEQPCCNREDYIQSGAEAPTLVIQLQRDHFEPGIEYWGSPALAALIAGVSSAQDEPYGWNRVVQRVLAAEFVTLTSEYAHRDTLTFTLPALPKYSIAAPETVTVTLPPEAVVSRNEIIALPRLVVRATPGVLSVNGSLVDVPVESTLQDGTSTLEITASDDVWQPVFGEALAAPFEYRAACDELVRGLFAGLPYPSNLSSWNREVTPALLGESEATNFTAVTVELVSNETVRLLLPRVVRYDVLLPEAVDIVVPPQLLMSDARLELPTAVTIVPTPGRAVLAGTGLVNISEAQLAFNRTIDDFRLEIHLRADTWQSGDAFAGATQQLLRGIRSLGDEEYGCAPRPFLAPRGHRRAHSTHSPTP